MKYLDMSGLGVNGFIGFSVKAKDNKANREVHEGFMTLAEDEFSGDYTATLKFLLDNSKLNVKEEALFLEMNGLRERLSVVEGKLVEPVVKEDVNEVSF